MGTTFSELMRWRRSSRVWIRPAARSTSMCFMMPKRVRWGNVSTISVVVRGPSRSRSRIARLVLSERAFHTGSSSSPGTLASLSRGLRGGILRDAFEDEVPAFAHVLAVRRVNHTNGVMAEIHVRAAGALFELELHVIDGRVGHEH